MPRCPPSAHRCGREQLKAHWARVLYPENWEDMDGFRADLYLDVTDVWDDYMEVLKSHEFIRGGISILPLPRLLFRARHHPRLPGRQTARRRPHGPDGSWTRRVEYLPGLEPK